MQDLIKQYGKALYQVNKAKETAPEHEQRILGSMASDLQYALEWLKTARRPGSRRGVERRAAYQITLPADQHLLQQIIPGPEQEEELPDIGEWNRLLIEDAMSTLTSLEKEVYIMARVGCMSYQEIAKSLRIAKSSVQTMMERAELKIKKQVQESLFCQCG